MKALGIQVGVGKNEFPWRVVWWQRLEKEAPMKRFWVGKTFSIAPITTQTTALANDQLPFPTLPLPPPLPPVPPVTPSPRTQDISSRRKIHAPGHGAPIGNRVASEHESLPATTTTTTITITITTTTTTTTTTAAVIAALASECCLQLSREGSGYGGCSGHHVPPSHPTSPYLVHNFNEWRGCRRYLVVLLLS